MTLPILSYTPEKIHECHYIKDSYDNNEEFYKLISDYTGADCWGMIVNDEILWNFYEETITDSIVRTHMIENPKLVLIKPEKIVIYMFGSISWGIIINRDNNNNKKFNVKISYESEDIYKWITKPEPTNKYEREIHYLEYLRLHGVIDQTIQTMDQLQHFDKLFYDKFRG
jgi:hypothetical protein